MKQLVNRNIIWAETVVNQFEKSGIKNAFLSPGSRSTPFVFAFARSKKLKSKIIIDERTSGFFSLGVAKSTDSPSVIVTTSGTAVAELYPAIIEAYNDRIPLIICTADRPVSLYNSGANQTINQFNIYRNHIRYFRDIGLPRLNKNSLAGLRKIINRAIFISTLKDPGPVHLNFHFEKPFEPDRYTDEIDTVILNDIVENKTEQKINSGKKKKFSIDKKFLHNLKTEERGIILTGRGKYDSEEIKNIIRLAERLNYPIFADGISPFRFIKNNKEIIVSNSSSFLKTRQILPKVILQFGAAPTSNVLLSFFSTSKAEKYLVNSFGDLHDPSKTAKKIFPVQYSEFTKALAAKLDESKFARKKSLWLKEILNFEKKAEDIKKFILSKNSSLFEGKVFNKLLKIIPENSNLMVSNSTPVRDLDFFASPSGKKINIFSNRGASGIDGVMSTALGIASSTKRNSFLVIGDLAFYHDINSLWIAKKYNINLSIILIDNSGGGIFQMLPVVKHYAVFNKFFKTPPELELPKIIEAFGVDYYSVKNWNDFEKRLNKEIKSKNSSVIHLKTDSKKSFLIRKKYWDTVVNGISKK